MARYDLPNVVVFRAEVGGECLWNVRGDCIEYKRLPLPTDLRRRLEEWNEHAWLGYEDQVSPFLAPGEPQGPTGFNEQWFAAEGRRLADDLRREFGPTVELRVEE